MTVKELKEELNKFSNNCSVFIENPNYFSKLNEPPYIEVTHISQGFNELDTMIILDNYEEDK